MTNEEVFNRWCPASSRWASWAKAVLFAQLLPPAGQSLRGEWQAYDVSWAPIRTSDTAIVVDLPGVTSLLTGLALAEVGYQPVPLFNCCAAPDNEVLPTDTMREYLVSGAHDMENLALPPTAPPAFILDSDPLAGRNVPVPGKFDNRWMAYPQDFPSGNFMKVSGIGKVIVVQAKRGQPALDLAAVLLRWQDAAIQIFAVDETDPRSVIAMTIVSPSIYRLFFLRMLARLRFIRGSAAGFGYVIPVESSRSG